jgi:hypothetical protein
MVWKDKQTERRTRAYESELENVFLVIREVNLNPFIRQPSALIMKN